MIFPKRGDVYWVNLDPTIGAEIKKTRPCVIISPDSANRGGPLVIVAPITKASGKKIYFHEILFPEGTANLPHVSKIKVFQLRCIDKKRLSQHPAGSLPGNQISVLNEKIRIVTGIYLIRNIFCTLQAEWLVERNYSILITQRTLRETIFKSNKSRQSSQFLCSYVPILIRNMRHFFLASISYKI